MRRARRARRCGGGGGGARAEPSAGAGALGGGGVCVERTNGLCRAPARAEATGGVGRRPAPSRAGEGVGEDPTTARARWGGGMRGWLAGACGPVVAGTGGEAWLPPRVQRGSQGPGPAGSPSLAREQLRWVLFVPSGCPEQAEERGAACLAPVRPTVPGPFAGWPSGSVPGPRLALVIAGAGVVRLPLSWPCFLLFSSQVRKPVMASLLCNPFAMLYQSDQA